MSQPIAGVLITSGGPHPPEKWAAMTASQIIQIAPEAKDPNAPAALRLQADIAELLAGHHGKVQDGERGALNAASSLTARVADAPLLTAHNQHADPEETVDAITAAAKGTPFEAHFERQDVRAHILQVVESHWRTIVDIERQWHASGGVPAKAEA